MEEFYSTIPRENEAKTRFEYKTPLQPEPKGRFQKEFD